MTNKEISDAIKQKYSRTLAKDPKVIAFYGKLRNGTAKMADVLKLATRSADILTAAFTDEFRAQFPAGIPPGVLPEILPDDLKKACDDVLDASRITVTSKNKSAGIGIQGLELDPDMDRIRNLADHLDESLVDGALSDETKGLVRNLVQSESDRSMKENTRFLDRSGVSVTVTREYTGTGLRDGPCQWCMDRSGSHVPVAEAIDRGMFARHEGCGCTIDYETSMGVKRQVDWTKNKWEDSPDMLEKRKTIGL